MNSFTVACRPAFDPNRPALKKKSEATPKTGVCFACGYLIRFLSVS
jgi:hypothetical protein